MEFFVDFNRQSDSSGLQQRLRRRKHQNKKFWHTLRLFESSDGVRDSD
jgi:hypothetical protein